MALLLALGTAMAVVIVAQASALMGPSAKILGSPGIVGWQFAGTAAAIDKFKRTWGTAGVAAAVENTRWDFSLIFGYTTGLALLGVLLHRSAAAVLGVPPEVLGAVVVGVPVLAGLCDIVENILTFQMLANEPIDAAARATTVLASIKWLALLITALWTLLIALPIALVRWFA